MCHTLEPCLAMVKQLLSVILLIIQVALALGTPLASDDQAKKNIRLADHIVSRPALPFLPTLEGETVKHVVDKRLRPKESSGPRRPRAIMSILSLLWPQVVGPMHDGIIQEQDFEEVAKTPLEHHLDTIRERSVVEVATRQHVRDLLNQGPPPGGPIDAHQHFSQMHLLHQLHPYLDSAPAAPPHLYLHHDPNVHPLQAILTPEGDFHGFHNVPGFS